MRRIPMARPAAVVLAAVIALVAVACYDVKPPPVPSAERVPTIVGQIVDPTTPSDIYRLSHGESVDIRDSEALETRVRLGPDDPRPPNPSYPDGGLILAGEDALGRFYAATRWPEADGCFRIIGPGYLEHDRVHLSSGLVLRLADNFRQTTGRFDDDSSSWLMDFDTICLNESGDVTFVHQASFGA